MTVNLFITLLLQSSLWLLSRASRMFKLSGETDLHAQSKESGEEGEKIWNWRRKNNQKPISSKNLSPSAGILQGWVGRR